MAVRRKSNWYIYFIAFGITLAMIIMAVISLKDFIFSESTETGLNTNGTLSEDFVPGLRHEHGCSYNDIRFRE